MIKTHKLVKNVTTWRESHKLVKKWQTSDKKLQTSGKETENSEKMSQKVTNY